MAGMRDYSDEEIDLVRKSFSGRYALRDRCYFEMALQMGLRVSEMLSITVGQVYQYGKVVDKVSVERKHMKGGQGGEGVRLHDSTLSRDAPAYPGVAHLPGSHAEGGAQGPPQRDAALLLACQDQGRQPRAIARETAWRIIKGIAKENEFSGKVGTHSTRKTLARKVFTWSKDIRVVQRILGHKSLQSTEAYLKSLTDREVWTAFRQAAA
jgi:site-specific recombinase XerD